MGAFATPLVHLVPGGLLDGQQQHLRQKIVDGAPQTVSPQGSCFNVFIRVNTSFWPGVHTGCVNT
eukprot:6833705-Prymnesium_polylepis.1